MKLPQADIRLYGRLNRILRERGLKISHLKRVVNSREASMRVMLPWAIMEIDPYAGKMAHGKVIARYSNLEHIIRDYHL